MTTREQIIAAAKEAGFPEWENTDDPEFLKVIEKLYVVAFKAGAASRGAEVVSLTNQRDYEYVRAENAEQERGQLCEDVTMLREALRDCAYDESGFCINPDAAEVLAAMEEKL